MKAIKINTLEIIAVIAWLTISAMIIETAHGQAIQDTSANQKLYFELIHKDSTLFHAALSTCDLKAVESLLDADFRFYPDNGGSTYTAYQQRSEFLEAIKKNFCDPQQHPATMRREIEPGTVQVFPLGPGEVLQTGIQRFYVANPGQAEKLVEVSKFTRTWVRKNGDWKMEKEFDGFVNTYTAHAPDSLYGIIQHEDSLLFDAYNTHNLAKIKTFFTEDLEFYHDKGGLTNYAQNMEAFANNFAKNNGIRRQLVSGSLEVYPVKDYGAMEIGEHKFCHEENGKQDCGTFKFGMVWKKTNEGWKISRVISYGH